MIRLDQINLPVFLIGAGIVHLVGLAALLPMAITLPGPGGDIEPKAVVVGVDIVPAAPPSPKVEPEVDHTSALPAAPQSPEASVEPDQAPAPGESGAQPEPKDAAPPAVANVSPEAAPSPDVAAADAAPTTEQKKKVESKGRKPAKVTRAAPKKSVARAKSSKPPIRRPARPKISSQPPYKGPFSALLNAPPGATAVKRK